MWRLECKGFHCNDDCTFTAIVPIWSNYSKQYCLYPVNHVKITGEVVNHREFDHNFSAYWHPDNPFSHEKWIEVNIISCKWKRSQRGEYVIESMQNMGYPQEYNGILHNTHRYFVPAKQLVPLHESSDIKFKSKDREDEEYENYEPTQIVTCYQ